MIIQFQVKNYLTFKEQATLSLVASNYDKRSLEDDNVVHIEPFKLRLLKSAAIYGANASGKTKLIEALRFMRFFVIGSSKDSQQGERIPVEPFLLNTETEAAPSEFELSFLDKEVIYRYGFEAEKDRVVSEWLYRRRIKENGRLSAETELFFRSKDEHAAHKSMGRITALVKEGMLRENALLLSVAAQFNDPIAVQVLSFFRNIRVISGLDEDDYQKVSLMKISDPESKAKVLKFLEEADFGIDDIRLKPFSAESIPAGFPDELREFILKKMQEEDGEVYSGVTVSRTKFNSLNEPVGSASFSLDNDESAGTIKFFSLAGVILDALEKGQTLVVDELDSKLHPRLVKSLIQLFNSKSGNPKHSQLIFNTHDVSVLSSNLFRRDQLWFVEKDRFGAAQLFSLADFKTNSVRKDERYAMNYLQGKYGAVPYLRTFDFFAEN